MDLRATLNLPDQNFTIPMKANLPEREPQLLQKWEEMDIYHRILESRTGAETFTLHDGPPYTNSPIHIGTAMQKVLKDFVVKSRTMMGYRCPYVPGYDNHGLPIELAVSRKFQEEGVTPDPDTFRKACRAHAQRYIDIQSRQFKRFGIFGLWDKPYTTMAPRFEAEIVRVFKRLVEHGYIYRGLRSTLWSPSSQTALADTEIIYKDHVSRSIYVRFPLLHDHNGFSEGLPNFYTIIWTTTPWTIPANLAVAFHPALVYAIVKVGENHYLIAEELVEQVAAKLGWDSYEIVVRELGASFEGSSFQHPIYDRPSVVVMADYVTTDEGTGVVHTAPSHGRDDFITGQKYGLPAPNTVDERGYLTAETGEFQGVFYKDCDTAVVDRLSELGALLLVEDYHHSYPYAERDEMPVIFRATEQWFLGIDHHHLRDRMLKEIHPIELRDFIKHNEQGKGVCWVPSNGYNRIHAMVSNRPDWCISRQRPWGVGIPIFYGKESGVPVMDPEAIEAVARIVEEHGSDGWFALPPEQILPAGYAHPETGETEFRKETDVLDVWFDSGCTSLCVFEGNVEPEWLEPWPADLYLEGSDQHRGWFNSSLVIGTAVRNAAPYRQVVTHGFVVDENGYKLSKRLGNSIDPEEAAATYGCDVLRYWVASVDYTNDVPCYDKLFQQFGEHYRRVRNTLRFLLSNLYDFRPGAEVPPLELDRWVLEQSDLLTAECLEAYREYDFNRVMTSVHNFCVNELSGFYLDTIKDRLYCDGQFWDSRRAAQQTSYTLLRRLTTLLAPLLPFTTEEVYERLPGENRLESVHMETFDVPTPEQLESIEGSEFQARFAALLEFRSAAFAAFEVWKSQSDIKDSQDAILKITTDPENAAVLRGFGDDLALYFKMSWVEIAEGETAFAFAQSPYPKCERSRLRRPDVLEVNGHFLTARDRRALGL